MSTQSGSASPYTGYQVPNYSPQSQYYGGGTLQRPNDSAWGGPQLRAGGTNVGQNMEMAGQNLPNAPYWLQTQAAGYYGAPFASNPMEYGRWNWAAQNQQQPQPGQQPAPYQPPAQGQPSAPPPRPPDGAPPPGPGRNTPMPTTTPIQQWLGGGTNTALSQPGRPGNQRVGGTMKDMNFFQNVANFAQAQNAATGPAMSAAQYAAQQQAQIAQQNAAYGWNGVANSQNDPWISGSRR